MNSLRNKFWIGMTCCATLAFAGLSSGKTALAQAYDVNQDAGYAADDDRNNDAPPAAAEAGPVRLARFSYVSGNVTWRPDDSTDWAAATVNMPLRQGTQIWVSEGGRAEVQFDDGSQVRLGSGAVATLQTLYSDADGEFTEINLTDGLAYLYLKTDHSIFQVDSPLVSLKAAGPARIRVGAGDGVEVGVRAGRATVEGKQGQTTLNAGDYLDLRDANSAYTVRDIPRADTWERWNEERDQRLADAQSGETHRHVPSNIAIVANDLDDYGTWRNDSQYGYVWCPRVSASDWRPYHYGHWTWVNPFGWTWVSEEAWGWAPYHYGTWVHASYGWGWVPGPTYQYWSPGVVHFSECEGRVAWVPLAPVEVRYPSVLSIGFHSGNWATYFSIGQAAVYYPGYDNYCVARPFNTHYVNRVTYVNNVTVINNNTYINQNNSASTNRYQRSAEYFAANNNTYLNGRSFVPYNARSAAGVSVASAGGFGGRGAYQAPSQGATYFTQGRTVGAPAGNRAPLAGPPAVRPTAEALAPTRTFVRSGGVTPPAQTRTIYRAPVRATIERGSQPITSAGTPLPNRDPRFAVGASGTRAAPGSTGRTPQTGTNPGVRGGVSNGSDTGRTGAPGTTNGNRGSSTGTRTAPANPSGTRGDSAGTHTLPSNPNGTRSNNSGTRTVSPDPNSSSNRTGRSSAAEQAAKARESLGVPNRNRDSGNTPPSRSNSTGSNGQTPGRNDNPNTTGRGSSNSGADRGNTPPSSSTGGTRSNSSGRGESANPPSRTGEQNHTTQPPSRSSESGRGSEPPHRDNPPAYNPPPRHDNPPPSSGSGSGSGGRGYSSGNSGNGSGGGRGSSGDNGGSSNSGNSGSGRGSSSGNSGGSGNSGNRSDSGASKGSSSGNKGDGTDNGSSNNSGGGRGNPTRR